MTPVPQLRVLFFDVFGTCVAQRTPVADELSRAAREALESDAASMSGEVRSKALAMSYEQWDEFGREWNKEGETFVRSSIAKTGTVDWKTVDQHRVGLLSELLARRGLVIPHENANASELQVGQGSLWNETQLRHLGLVWHRLPPWPDTCPGLNLLNKRFSTVTLSNAYNELLVELVAHSSIPFSHVYSADLFQSFKPSPTVYLGAAAKMGVKPEECALVAAHLGDLKGAKACGFFAIYVDRPLEEKSPGLRDENIPDMVIEQEYGKEERPKAREPKPFHFLRLPPELRNRVYDLCLVEPLQKRWRKIYHEDRSPVRSDNLDRCRRTPKCAMDIVTGNAVHLAEHPPLLAVCRQIRSEADPIYWGQNEWIINLDAKWENDLGYDEMDDDLRTPMQHMRKWVNKIGLRRLRHLRDFTVGIEIHSKRSRCEPYEFRVTLDRTAGLVVNLPTFNGRHRIVMRQNVLAQHLVTTERRRRRNGWKGEGIIDWFLGNRDFWAEWFFSYPADEDDETDDDDWDESDENAAWEDARRSTLTRRTKTKARGGRRSIPADFT
ncbi:hypothetical protein LTR85_004908 [Meristemomyces frigidus]|nr:hypothetical protein LTR85_004908 [Meristemomyces frigidus]